MASLGLSELLIAMVQGFGGARPASNALGELYEDLVQAINGFVANPIVNVSTLTTNNTATLDWNVAGAFDVTMSNNTVFTFANTTPGRTVQVTLRGAFTPTWPSVAWQPSAPAYASTTSYEFWVTQTGEVRGTAIVGVAANTYDAFGAAAAVLATSLQLTGGTMTGPLTLNSSQIFAVTSKAASYTTLSTDTLVDLTGTTAAQTLTLGTTSFTSGQVQMVKNASTQAWTIAAATGATDVTTLASNGGLITFFDGTNWKALATH